MVMVVVVVVVVVVVTDFRRKGRFGVSDGKDADKDDKAASCLYTC